MNRALLKKCLYEAKGLLLSCAAALFVFCWLRVWIVSRIDMGSFQTVLEQLWDKYEPFSPVPLSQLLTYTGRIALAYDEPIVVLCISVWAIARGSDCVSGELGRGTMEMLLAQPVSRLQILLTQATVTVVGVALLSTMTWLGVSAGIHTHSVQEEVAPTLRVPVVGEIPIPLLPKQTRTVPMTDRVQADVFIPASLNLFSLGFFLAGLSTFMSSWDRYRWRTIGLVVGIYVVQMMTKIVGMAADDFAWLNHFTFFAAYEPEIVVSVASNAPQDMWNLIIRDDQGRWLQAGPLGYDLVLLGLGSLAYLAAAVIFCRRDLPAPL